MENEEYELQDVEFDLSSEDVEAATFVPMPGELAPCSNDEALMMKTNSNITSYTINGDCLEYMNSIPDNSIDMVLCDLPYGTTQNKWDTVIDLPQLWTAYERVCKPNAAIVLTAAQPFTSVLVYSNLRDFKYQWVWQKEAGTGLLNAKKQPLRDHEDVLVFYQKQCLYSPQMTVGKPYVCKKGGETSNYNPSGSVVTVNEGTRCPKTVLQFKRDAGKVHPTQKPVALMEYLIKTYTNEGMTVLDNCMGSGTTGVACMRTNRNFLGIELDPIYYAIAVDRISQAKHENHLQDVEFDLSSEDVELDAVGDELDDAGNECQCVRAVKIKDGGPNCLICGLNAYNSQYSFSHTPGGIALLAAHQGAQRPAPVDLAAPLLASVPEPPRMAAEPKKIKVPKPPKPPKPAKAKKKEKTVNPLFEAVKFIALAQKSKGDEMTTHCMIAYGGITAFDRTIACGVVIKEDELNCIPNTELLLQALSHCGPEYTIVQLPESLHIASGDFAAYVPCTTADKMVTAVPDPSVAPLSDEFREAIKIVGALVKDTGTTLLQAAIQLNPYTVIATNGQVIMEAFHGHDMPPTKMLVPKGFADRLNKTKKVIKSFGFTAETFTVHFEDRSWMRTNLYKGAMEYDIHAAINIEAINKHPIPGNFFEAADEVAKWSKDGRVFLYDSRVSSHDRESQTVGSCRTFAMDGFANNRIYSIAALKTISKVALSMDDTSARNLALFFGTKVRGALKYDVMRDPPPPIGSVEWTYCDACQQHSHHNPSHQCRNPACAKFGVINPQDDDIPF